MADWTSSLKTLRTAVTEIERAQAELAELHDRATADIVKWLRQDQGVELDVDAIKATLARPYTLIPSGEHEATLIHWRGVKLPIFGWVIKQEPAFTIAKVSRSMDLLTPLPAWMKQEMGWKPPEHQAVIGDDRSSVHVRDGDDTTFKKKYGAWLGAKTDDGFKIRGGDAWIRLLAALIRDGILPFTPKPVADADWNDDATSEIVLRDYQKPFVDEFRRKGAVFYNLPPGAGKTMLTLTILAHLVGPAVIFAPSVILCEQWRERVQRYTPQADVTILTYASGKKAAEKQWKLVVFDEVQTLPADTFSKLAFLQADYRVGLSASPWREDGRQFMITALSGYPCSIRWADLIRAGVLKKPRVVIATVANDAAKTAFTRHLLAQRRGGRALIFCDYLEQGEQLAHALHIPFVSGETPRKFQRVQEAEECVVSRIADRGLDFADLSLVVEVAFMGRSREQEAQRLGRLLHSQVHGEHYLLFTPEEAEKFRPRIFGIESELAGEIDIEFVNVGKISERREAQAPLRHRPTRAPAAKVASARPQSEVDRALANPAVERALKGLYASATERVRRGQTLHAALKVAWDAPISLEELRVGRGIRPNWLSTYKAAFNLLIGAGFVSDVGAGRYFADRTKIQNIVKLSSRFGKG